MRLIVKNMNSKNSARLIIVMLILSTLFTLLSILPTISAQNTNLSYKLANPANGAFSITLNVEVPLSLIEYYRGLSHRSSSDSDFPKFVTPYAVKPIADAMRQIYPNDEDFANGVLTLIHQIPYNATVPEFYPVETLQMNNGDCDMFSLLAASIMKAGGLDVVLLHYTNEEHMNIGVHLNDSPNDARLPIYSIQNQNVTYYVAESTSSTYSDGWRVGECPDDLKNATISIVTLENSEQMAPGQVSASFTKLDPTTLEISMSPAFAIEGNEIKIKGQISPAVSNQNVTLYTSVNGASWTIVDNVTTQSDGHFSYDLKTKDTGYLSIQASWAGNSAYTGDTSKNASAFILPLYIIELTAATIIGVVLCIVICRMTGKNRREKQTMESPQFEESSSE
jgi:hypothetical protein